MEDDFGRKGKWTVNFRQDSVLYDNDELIVIKGISKQKMILLNNHYINKVSDLKEKLTTITEKKELVKKMKGIGLKSLNNWCDQAQNSSHGSCPPMKDHTLSDNPLKSLYGDKWKQKSKTCRGFCSINELIDHMFTESEKMFKGTINEDDYAVYHDALSLMTANEPIEYMKRKGYWDRLIRPLFNVTKHLGCYHNRFVGNHPYVMPLDAHLNQDLHTGHDWHCIITKHLNKDD